MTVTALSPRRMSRAEPVVFACDRLQVCTGPFGPLIDAVADETASGIIAITGSPAGPVHPQNESGFGVSVENRSRLVVVPFAGQRTGVVGRGAHTSPSMTSRVAADCQGDVDVLAHSPKPTL